MAEEYLGRTTLVDRNVNLGDVKFLVGLFERRINKKDMRLGWNQKTPVSATESTCGLASQ